MKQIAFISDIHLNEQFPIDHHVDSNRNWETILEDIKAKAISDIVFGGDIGDHTSHQWFFETLKPFNLKLVLGNHDEYQQVTNYYKKGINIDELYYQFEDSHYKCIFLDSSSDIVSNEQLQWLKREVLTDKKILLFIHHPILEVNTPVDRLYPLKNREDVKFIIKNIPNEVTIFCGHYHMNDELIEDNIRQIITQAASFQITKFADDLVIDNSMFGYRIIDIGIKNITTRIVNFKI